MTINSLIHHPRSTIHHPNNGFTLIEIIVVVTIILTLTGVGLAGYNSFNQRQVLKQGAMEVRSHLRDAQNRALAGEKIKGMGEEGISCDNLTLDDWRVDFILDGGSYSLNGRCNNTDFLINNYTLSNNLVIDSASSPSIIFKPIAQGGDNATIIIKHTQTFNTITLTVSPSGEINIGEIEEP